MYIDYRIIIFKHKHKTLQEQLKEMIAEADIDKDGSVDFNEFQVLSLII